MASKGYKPNVVNILIDGFCSANKIKELCKLWVFTQKELGRGIGLFLTCKDGYARKLFGEMQLDNVPPDLITHNILIDGLCKNGQ